MDRLVVFVNPDQGHIDVETRKIEVVRIAAKERRLKFGRKHQPYVGVPFVTIEIVLAALVKRDHVRPQARRLG